MFTTALVFVLLSSSISPVSPVSPVPPPASRICEAEEIPLFICETNRQEKYLAICATEEEPGERWSGVQYRFGPGEHAELVYPSDGDASKLLFSHVRRGFEYIVSIRFTSGEFGYRIESHADEHSDPPGQGWAGVKVTDGAGKTVADIRCVERPLMYPEYLRLALACDTKNPLGKAACEYRPPALPK